jgi:hypothetical protein
MMCSQISLIGSLWFSTGEAQEMADMSGAGALDLSVLEYHTFLLAQVNEAHDDLPARHGGFSNYPLPPATQGLPLPTPGCAPGPVRARPLPTHLRRRGDQPSTTDPPSSASATIR